jgi:hypothetical protein
VVDVGVEEVEEGVEEGDFRLGRKGEMPASEFVSMGDVGGREDSWVGRLTW